MYTIDRKPTFFVGKTCLAHHSLREYKDEIGLLVFQNSLSTVDPVIIICTWSLLELLHSKACASILDSLHKFILAARYKWSTKVVTFSSTRAPFELESVGLGTDPKSPRHVGLWQVPEVSFYAPEDLTVI